MTKKEYQKSVLKRFKKVRRRLDKTVDDYIVKEFGQKPIGLFEKTNDFLLDFFNDNYYDNKNSSAESQNCDETFIDDYNDDNEVVKKITHENTRLKKNYSGKLNGVCFGFLVLELGRYTRKTSQKVENFTYFEVYDKYGITSILVKSDKSKQVLIKELSLNDSDYKMINEQIKFGSSFVKVFRKKRTYVQDWIEDYHINEENILKNPDADAIISCPNPKLVYTIAGYAILAYMMQFSKIHNKILALNIVTDNNSDNVIIHNLIQKCFVNSGYNDNTGIVIFNAKAKAEIYYPNCEGRCIVINAMSKQSVDSLQAILPRYFLYVRETTREVEYPYLFLPIILSSEPLGNEFYTIKAKKYLKIKKNGIKYIMPFIVFIRILLIYIVLAFVRKKNFCLLRISSKCFD